MNSGKSVNSDDTPGGRDYAPEVALSLQEMGLSLKSFYDTVLEQPHPSSLGLSAAHIQGIPGRARFAFSYFAPALQNIVSWLYRSTEETNFTYDISDLNKDYLSSFISLVTGVGVNRIRGYISELDSDRELRDYIATTAQSAGDWGMDASPHYGRRVGWYAFARAIKPKIIVETGVDKGLGSCVLCSALLKNSLEGSPGRYFGTDISPNAGYLLRGRSSDRYASVGQILYGDSIESLKVFDGTIDLFINDSDHSADYELREYEIVSSKLSQSSIILGDNSHGSNSLFRFAQTSGRKFLFFPERPKDHWYPGAGIGMAWR